MATATAMPTSARRAGGDSRRGGRWWGGGRGARMPADCAGACSAMRRARRRAGTAHARSCAHHHSCSRRRVPCLALLPAAALSPAARGWAGAVLPPGSAAHIAGTFLRCPAAPGQLCAARCGRIRPKTPGPPPPPHPDGWTGWATGGMSGHPRGGGAAAIAVGRGVGCGGGRVRCARSRHAPAAWAGRCTSAHSKRLRAGRALPRALRAHLRPRPDGFQAGLGPQPIHGAAPLQWARAALAAAWGGAAQQQVQGEERGGQPTGARGRGGCCLRIRLRGPDCGSIEPHAAARARGPNPCVTAGRHTGMPCTHPRCDCYTD
jgi:hypothetical protein